MHAPEWGVRSAWEIVRKQIEFHDIFVAEAKARNRHFAE